MSLNARPLGNEVNTLCALSAFYLTINVTIRARGAAAGTARRVRIPST